MSTSTSSPDASTGSEDNNQSYRELPPRLLTSNLPPTDQEVLHVRSTILPVIQENRDSLKARISSLRETFRRLRAEQDAMNEEYERCESLVSTRRIVPCEIWAHIFSYFRESSGDQWPFAEHNAFSPTRTLWTISQVCQTWRNIAFSIPSLWSCIELTFPLDGQKEIDVYMLERILRMSRQHPLRIVLSNTIDFDCPFGPSYRNLMLGKIFAESHRWRSAELAEDWADSDVLFPAETLHSRLPLLESLRLDVRQGQADGSSSELEAEDQPIIWVFENCPRLSKVRLTGGRRAIGLQWAQITELDITDTDGNWLDDDCISYVRSLRQCPSLKALHMTPFDYVEEDQDASEITTLDCLHKLDTTCVRLLNHLRVPHLQEAILRKDPRWESLTAFDAFRSLVDRSNCVQSITSLTIDDIALPTETQMLHGLLLCTTNITHLSLRLTMSLSRPSLDEIQRPPNTDLMEEVTNIILSLEVPEEQCATHTHPTPFLPRLSSLSVELMHHGVPGYVPYFGREGLFPQILRSRWRGTMGVARLETCKIVLTAAHLEKAVFRDFTAAQKTWHVMRPHTEVDALQALIAEGMKFSIKIVSDLVQQYEKHVVLELPVTAPVRRR